MRVSLRSLPAAALTAAILGGCSDDNTGPSGLTPPASVQVTAISAASVRVTFGSVTGATSYIVERAARAAGGTFASVGTPTASPFDDNTVQPSTVYRYRVAAVSGALQSAFSTDVPVTTPAPQTVTVSTDITANTTWTRANKYILQGFIHVASGATLTIEPGTRIEGDFNTVGSSLFVLRGARIMAVGTASDPIVFTSSRPVGQRQAGDWGGLIIIGNGIINRGSPVILEGTGSGAGNPALDYSGGTNNADNSGILRYVRVEFAGYATAADQELNSFTFAAVGSGTELSFLQSLNGLDDSFEFFGGAVDAKNLVSYNSGDDHFDMAEGYVGRIQFAIAYQNIQVVPRPLAGNISNDPQGIENDGCNGANCPLGQNSTPFTVPLVANFTLVGPPAGVNAQGTGLVGMMLRRGTGGFYVNGVVARWGRAAVSLRDQPTLDRITSADLTLRNTYMAENLVTFQAAAGTTVQGTLDPGTNNLEVAGGATTAASQFLALPAAPAGPGDLDWTPSATAATRTGGLVAFTGALQTRAGTFVTPTTYRGAADPNGAKWWQGWTSYATN